MLTKNFLHICASALLGVSISEAWDSLVAWNGKPVEHRSGYKNYSVGDGRILNLMKNHPKVDQSSIPSNIEDTSSWTKNGVCFGSGTTPASENDYCMEGELLTEYSYMQNYVVNKNSVTYVYTITNNGSEPFTIGEVGLLSYAVVYTSSWYKSSGILLDRTVLESPITISPQGVGQITYTIKMDGLV